jgi:hypothetical protein
MIVKTQAALRRRRRNTHRDRRRGYTVVELMIAATLGALVVLAGLRWAGGISEIALGALRSGDARTAVVAIDRIGDDLVSARHCDTFARDALVRSMTPSSVTFIADPDGNGAPDAVFWRFSDGLLQRAVTSLGTDCVPVQPTVWSTQLTDAVIVSFRPVVEGLASTNPDDYPVCTDAFGPGCELEALTVHITRESSTESLESTFPVNTN